MRLGACWPETLPPNRRFPDDFGDPFWKTPMTLDEYSKLSASDTVALVASRALSATELTRTAFAALDAAEPRIHAFATLDRDGAFRAAQAVDESIARGEAVGPLAGVPVAIKDLVLTKGLRTTFGSRLYADYIPESDDVVVERLRAAGAIILGKTNASEFGFGAHGRNLLFETTRNPWDLSRTPGGSSAGSAAAVSAGVCPLSIGSDGGGSIRIPSAFCGLFGMKASMGRVPLWPGCRDERLPGASGWESIEHVGPITRTVADAALMLSVIAGPDARDRLSLPAGDVDWLATARLTPPRGLRIAYWPQWRGQPIDRRVHAVVESSVAAFAKAYDLDVELGEPPAIALNAAFQAIIALETDLNGLRRLIAEKGEPVTPAVKDLLAQRLPLESATDAMTTRKAFANAMAQTMARFDLILTPTVPVLAFSADREGPDEIDGRKIGSDEWCPFTFPFNLTGQPAASAPCGLVDGLPVGIQIAGAHLGDAAVLTAAAAFERIAPPLRAAFSL
jgi:aspartyl-tRNA(Asn)/glutamyl-tRNA(Gln) amidotransferase subunit A